MTKAEAEKMKNDTDKFFCWVVENDGIPVAEILRMTGVWEIVSEELNNNWCDFCDSLID